MNTNETVVMSFIKAWETLDVDYIVSFFAEDGVYHNMPLSPISGRSHLRAFIAGFIRSWSSTTWDVVNLASSEARVFAERIDRIQIGTRSLELPCCGVFELADAKIRVWRDYFDMATYTRALNG